VLERVFVPFALRNVAKAPDPADALPTNQLNGRIQLEDATIGQTEHVEGFAGVRGIYVADSFQAGGGIL
jgi:hypothetical protein